MRFALLCSIALGANIVVASVCKPRQSTDSAISVADSSTVSEISSTTSTELETATAGVGSSDTTTEAASTDFATTTELATTTTYVGSSDTIVTSDVITTITASADLSTSAATLTSEDETTVETMTTEPSSTYTAESTTTLSEADTTTLAVTTTTAAVPIETFQVFAGDKGLLMGRLIELYNNPGFLRRDLPVLDLTIEPTTSFVLTNNFYMCAQYSGVPYYPATIVLCNGRRRDDPEYSFVTCEKTVDHGFVCSVPAAACGYDLTTQQNGCRSLDGVLSQFYLAPQGPAFGLLLGSKDHTPGFSITSVDLQTT